MLSCTADQITCTPVQHVWKNLNLSSFTSFCCTLQVTRINKKFELAHSINTTFNILNILVTKSETYTPNLLSSRYDSVTVTLVWNSS